jgi:clan AA aspartic protease (TIGR02281 family)
MRRFLQTRHSGEGMARVLAWVVLVLPAPADTVQLRGGRTLEGIVVEETAETVTLDIGMGHMSFARGQVVDIVRSSDQENQGTRQAWELRYISESDLPADLKPVYRNWDRLLAIRARGLNGGRALESLWRELTRLNRSILATRQEYRTLSQDLADTPVERNVKVYNQRVQRNNELVARLNREQATVNAGEEREQALRRDISRYARELTQFEHEFAAVRNRYRETAGNEIAQAWLQRTATALAGFADDFSRMSISAVGSAGGTRLEVTLNDRESGTFILDTGASIVTLTETMARKLKLRYDPARPALLRLADGQTSEGYPVVLDAVSVGEARAEQVPAVVVPHGPGDGLDGLLGMSFLGRFEMSFDASTDRLELRQLRAR